MFRNAMGKLHIRALNYKTLILLGIVIVAVFSVLTANGADDNSEYERMYALRVETGATSNKGDVGTFIVTYIDNNNNTRRAYINPYDGDYANSINLARSKRNEQDLTASQNIIKKRIETYENVFGYTFDWSNDDRIASDDSRPLKPRTTDVYFFTTYYDVKEIVSIGIVKGDGNQKNWQCFGMSLYKVDHINGVVPQGYMSNTIELGFSGRLMETLEFQGTGDKQQLVASFDFSSKGVIYLDHTSLDSTANEDILKTTVGTGTRAHLVRGTGEQYSSLETANNQYTIKIDIADTYLAGFEAYVAKNKKATSLSERKPAEILVLNLDYKTPNNTLRSVTIPVLTSALSYALETGAIKADTPIADLITQGDSLAFVANLPEFVSIERAKLFYIAGEDAKTHGENSLANLVGMKSTQAATEAHKKYYGSMAQDEISIENIQIYQGGSAARVVVEDGEASLKVEMQPSAQMLYWAEISDYSLKAGAEYDLKFKASSAQAGQDDRKLFLFEAKTANLTNSGTTSDIEATISYIDEDDKDRQFSFSFVESAHTFYGYWPDENGPMVGYESLMQSGATYYALLNIERVKKIVGITVANKGKDDWLAESISIYEVTDNSKIGGISYTWNDGADKVQVIHGREVNGHLLNYQSDLGSMLLLDGNMGISQLASIGFSTDDEGSDDTNKSYGIFIGGDKKREINFNSAEVGKQSDGRTNFFEYMFDMPYDVATTRFGFDSKAVVYEVDVQVGSKPYGLPSTGLQYDDCGSSNYFYFQLVFDKGNSAYVQANQQMESDGFRSGAKETFYIYVNQEYGDLKAINIVPEIDPDNGNPYDKLMIEEISVIRGTENGLSRTFHADKVDWIGIDYSDKGAKTNYHKASDLVKTYPITSETNNVDLLFTIGSDCLPEGYNQFVGTASAKITYVQTDGQEVEEYFDVVNAMHIFNGTDASAKDSDHSIVNKKKETQVLKVSDPNLMFRPNHTDRFIFRAENIKYVKSMMLDLHNYAGESVAMNLTGVSMQILNNGDISSNRAVNVRGEYILDSPDNRDCAIIYSKDDGGSLSSTMDNKAPGAIFIPFEVDEDSCICSMDTNKLPYVVTKQPGSNNDMVNIYAFVSNTKADLTGIGVEGYVEYVDKGASINTVRDDFHLTSIMDENGNMRQAYCCENLLVKDYSNISRVGLRAYNGASGSAVVIDYVVVQHVRLGVVLGSYKLKYSVGPMDVYGLVVYTDKDLIEGYNTVPGYQEITIQFGDRMDKSELVKAQRDIAISLDYLFGNSTQEFKSENFFLTEAEGVRSVGPGSVVKLIVHNANVGRINGISISATDFLKIDVKAVTIGVYTPVKGNSGGEVASYECTNWYSFECNDIVNNEMKHFKVSNDRFDSSDTWSPVTMSIKTLSNYAFGNGNLGADLGLTKDQSLKLVVTYDDDGVMRDYVVNNIVDKLSSGDLNAGSTAEFTFLAKNLRADNIKKVSFQPYDNDPDSHLFWGLDSVGFSFGDGVTSTDTVYVEPKKVIYEDNGLSTISFAKVIMEATVQQIDAELDSTDMSNIVSYNVREDLGVINQISEEMIYLQNLSEEDIFRIEMNVQNSDEGYDAMPGIEFNQYYFDDDAFYFSLSGMNVNDETSVKFYSVENPDCYIEVQFKILSVVEPEETETETEETEAPVGTEESTETESSGATDAPVDTDAPVETEASVQTEAPAETEVTVNSETTGDPNQN